MQELETHKGQTLPSCDMCTHIKEGRSMKEATTKQGDCNYQITHGHICTHGKNSLQLMHARKYVAPSSLSTQKRKMTARELS